MTSPSSFSLLAIGSELLDGRVLDTNSQFMSNELSNRGYSTRFGIHCEDTIEDITGCLEFLFRTSDFIVLSGGLGPTSDDLTREAVASYFSIPLETNSSVLEWLHDLYRQRKRSFDPSNTKQATFPIGASVLPNPVGTAAGFLIWDSKKRKGLAALPGVPTELHRMFLESVLPFLEKEFPNELPMRRSVIRLFGLPESVIGSTVRSCNLPEDIIVSYLASFPEVKVTLKARRSVTDDMARVRQALGEEYIFSTDLKIGFEQALQELLLEKKETVGVAESCTGGMIGAALTETPGSSSVFAGGIIAYSNQIKQQELNVPRNILDTHGAVSHETVRYMAEGVRKKFQSSIGISISGIAGPDGATPEKPVGTFFIGFSNERELKSYRFFLLSSRPFIRKYSTFKALDIIRREILGLSTPTDAVEYREH